MAATQFTAKVEMDILAGDVNRKTMTSQPTIEKVDWLGLGLECFTIEGTAVMVNDEAVASFTIEPLKMADVVTVSRPLNKKAEVDGDTLTTLGGMARICSGSCSFMKLGLGTDGAGVQLSGNGNQRHIYCLLVHI
jgi:hypothetical protein